MLKRPTKIPMWTIRTFGGFCLVTSYVSIISITRHWLCWWYQTHMVATRYLKQRRPRFQWYISQYQKYDRILCLSLTLNFINDFILFSVSGTIWGWNHLHEVSRCTTVWINYNKQVVCKRQRTTHTTKANLTFLFRYSVLGVDLLYRRATFIYKSQIYPSSNE